MTRKTAGDSGNSELVTRARFAEVLGISPAAVSKGIKKGRLGADALGPDKLVRLPIALEQWTANRDPQIELDRSERKSAGSSDYRDLKIVELQHRGELRKIELGRAQDRYRDKDDVHRSMVTCGRRIAQRIELIAHEIDSVASVADPLERRRAAQQLTRKLRDDIAQTLSDLVQTEDLDSAVHA